MNIDRRQAMGAALGALVGGPAMAATTPLDPKKALLGPAPDLFKKVKIAQDAKLQPHYVSKELVSAFLERKLSSLGIQSPEYYKNKLIESVSAVNCRSFSPPWSDDVADEDGLLTELGRYIDEWNKDYQDLVKMGYTGPVDFSAPDENGVIHSNQYEESLRRQTALS